MRKTKKELPLHFEFKPECVLVRPVLYVEMKMSTISFKYYVMCGYAYYAENTVHLWMCSFRSLSRNFVFFFQIFIAIKWQSCKQLKLQMAYPKMMANMLQHWTI